MWGLLDLWRIKSGGNKFQVRVESPRHLPSLVSYPHQLPDPFEDSDLKKETVSCRALFFPPSVAV
jgi:hypothetical protein